jgi:hypothetical protein
MATLLPEGKQSFTTNGSLPLAGGKVYTYIPGTSTPKDTYTTSAASVANANPVILDSRGEATIFWSGAYDVILKTSADVTIWGPIRHETPEISGSAAAVLTDLASTSDAAKGDALVGVKRTATGAVATTLHNYIERSTPTLFDFMTSAEIADVQAGTLLVDVTAKVQAALDAYAGKEIFCPAGSYLITTRLEMLAFTTLTGASSGFGLLTKFYTPTDIETLHARSVAPGTGAPIYGLTVRNIRFENTTPVVAGAGMTKFQLWFEEATLARIEDCTFVNNLADSDYNVNNGGGIRLGGGSGGIFLNSIHKCGVQGKIQIDCTDSIISLCHVFAQNGDFGIKLNAGNNAVQGCYDLVGSRNHGAVWLNAVDSCRIEGNFFDIQGGGIYSNNGACNTFSGNTYIGTAKPAIELIDPLGFSIRGETFLNCGTDDLTSNGSSEIIIKGVSYAPIKNTISGCSFRKVNARTNTSYAIYELNGGADPSQNTFVGNVIEDGGTQYASPAIKRVATTGVQASKVVGNAGKSTETEVLSTFTPTWGASGTAPAIGNGLLQGIYSRQGNTVTASITLAPGSTTTYGTGTWTFSLPISNAANDSIGTLLAFDTSTGTYTTGVCNVLASASTAALLVASGATASWGATAPFTWATGDALRLTITYPIA